MRRTVIFVVLLFAGVSSGAQTLPALDAPLPNPKELLQHALVNENKRAAVQEHYACRVTDTTIQTNKHGKVRKASTVVREQFFVNGIPIERTISRNGKDLSPEQVKKQDERVMKETLKYSNRATAKKKTDKQDRQVRDLIKTMMLTHGRREIQNGRSVLFYNIVPNPRFHARNLTQRFARVMQGTISIDEQTGEMIDLNIKSVADLRIAGGLLASLHKGFWLHVHNHAEPDGVWLNDLAEGSGNARAALFFHPYFRFKETTGDCHLYTAKAMEVGKATLVK